MKPVLPRMTEAFVQSLTLATSDMILKTEVLKVTKAAYLVRIAITYPFQLLSLLMEKFPKLLASFLPQISDAIFVLFKQSLTE